MFAIWQKKLYRLRGDLALAALEDEEGNLVARISYGDKDLIINPSDEEIERLRGETLMKQDPCFHRFVDRNATGISRCDDCGTTDFNKIPPHAFQSFQDDAFECEHCGQSASEHIDKGGNLDKNGKTSH